MESLKIILFATLAAIIYGVLHDQVTAHVCVEYFTIAHPPVFGTNSPFLLALGWGVIATWWVGLPLGIALALAARLGRARRLGLADLRGGIVRLMVASAAAAGLSGGAGMLLVANGVIDVPGGWDAVLPPGTGPAFSFAAFAHLASYLAGIIGGLLLIGNTVWRRACR